ncbi:MAG: hypothetical protein IPH86_14270 [bacterium]|nr:hypothetical protein [bacterium]
MVIRATALGAIRAMVKKAILRMETGAMQWPETLVMVTAPSLPRASMSGPVWLAGGDHFDCGAVACSDPRPLIWRHAVNCGAKNTYARAGSYALQEGHLAGLTLDLQDRNGLRSMGLRSPDGQLGDDTLKASPLAL